MSDLGDFLTFTLSAPSSSLPSTTTSSLPPDLSLLLTDTLDAPATFLLVQLAARALKPAQAGPGKKADPRRRAVVVGVRERADYWAATLKKHGIQLATESAAQRFAFVDASSPATSLEELFTATYAALSPFASPAQSPDARPPPPRSVPPESDEPGPLVIVDDLSALMWVGREPREVVQWWRGLRTLATEYSASLVTLLHADSLSPSPALHTGPSSSIASPYASPDDQYVFRQVLQVSDLWLEVVGLGNGGTGARGELSLHRAPGLVSTCDGGPAPHYQRRWSVDAPRSGARALQYKLEEGGAVWEVKGQMGGRVW